MKQFSIRKSKNTKNNLENIKKIKNRRKRRRRIEEGVFWIAYGLVVLWKTVRIGVVPWISVLSLKAFVRLLLGFSHYYSSA